MEKIGKKSLKVSLVVALCAAMFGCSGTAENSATNTPPSATSSTPQENATNSASETASSKPAADLATLPAEFKNDAFEYYGLGRTDPVKLEINRNKEKLEGSQVVKYVGIENGKAIFEVEGGGVLEGSTGTLALEKGGIKILKSAKAKVFADEWEFPSGLTPGKSWTSNNEMTDGSQTTKLSNVNKVIGIQPVTAGKNTYKEALLVETKSQGTRNGLPVSIVTKNWFVKGRGMVKVEYIATPKDGKTETMTLEEPK